MEITLATLQMVFVTALLSPMLCGRLLGIPLAYQLQFEIGIRNLELIGQAGRQLSIINCHVFRNVLHVFWVAFRNVLHGF